MGNNKRFNDILNECLEHMLAGDETLEQGLQRYPEYASELEPLLRTAITLKKAVDIKPSADARARVRYQLQSVMAKPKIERRVRAAVPRWAVAVCAVLLVFVLSGSTVLAADGSMPGNPLYAVKLMTENVRISLAGSEEDKAELYAAFAGRRVAELEYMVEKGKLANAERVAQRLYNHYVRMGELAFVAAIDSVATAAVQAPAPAMLGAESYGSDTTTLTTEVPDAEAGANGNGRASLKQAFIYYASTQQAKIQALLDSDKVPESAKIALRRALRAAGNDYQNAIDNLGDP